MYHWQRGEPIGSTDKQLFFWGNAREMEDYLGQFLLDWWEKGLGLEEILLLSPHREVGDRLEHLLLKLFASPGDQPRVATLQGFCLELLNREGYGLGLRGRPEAIGGWQEFLILKNLLSQMAPQSYDSILWGTNGFVREILGFCNHLWGQGIRPGEFWQRAHKLSQPQLLDLANVFSRYVDFCRQEGYLPLAAIAPLALQLLLEHPPLLEGCREGRRLLIATDLDLLKPVQLQIVKKLFTVFPYFLGLAFQDSPLKEEAVAWGTVQPVLGEEIVGERRVTGYRTWEMESWGVTQEIARLLIKEEYDPRDIVIYFANTSMGQSLKQVLTATGIPYQDEIVGDTPLDPVLSFLLNYLNALTEADNDAGHMKWLSSSILNLDALLLQRSYYEARGQGRPLLEVLVDTAAKEYVELFLRHLQGLGTGNLSPLIIVEELYKELGLIGRYVDELGREGGEEEARGILGNLRNFLLLIRECEYLNSRFEGKGLGLSIFLEQLQGALPYLNREIPAAKGQGRGVTLAHIRDAYRYRPRAAFLPTMAADLYPPQRIPSPLLAREGWRELRAGFPHLDLPVDLEAHRFHAKYRIALKRCAALADQTWFSWAQCYPQLEKTGPSDLLCKDLKSGTKAKDNADCFFTWPDPNLGANTKERLCNFYRQQISLTKNGPLARTQKEPGQMVPTHRDISSFGEEGVQVEYYTPSAIKSYLACPRRYYYQNILKLRIAAHPWAQLGLLLHQVLASFHRHFPSLFGVEEEVAQAYLKKIFTDIWQEIKPSLGRGLLMDFYHREAQSICKAYLARELPSWEPERRARVEETLDFTFGKYRLRGRYDRLDKLPGGGWEIIDYKMGRDRTEGQRKRDFLPQEGEEPVDMQLLIYYLGARERGMVPESLTWYQLSQLLAGGKVKRSLSLGEGRGNITPGDLKEGEKLLQEILAKMQRAEYPPKPRNERICNHCPFRFPCSGPNPLQEGEENE